ncbi:PREDICTED: fibrous sheath CABYR-binding protein [Condylura cristata]|uniref:fibrous sheath CABYR-binding protein n=1 Tax=Condylura cristata TaxID=143302 RepID=UPI000642D321|nr:PREDICTED: fibrous sheath CABYR-binding protein [Condylura cristata]
MEERDEPDQPISARRQEFRKRRKPSQPMVDKSQQTEVAEKKRHLSTSQSSGPKATHSIGNIPGSKAKYDSLRLSSQIQKSWTKRKHGQAMTDVSLQTDSITEEKKQESRSFGETVLPEEKPAAVGEAAPEIPKNVQEVENPPLTHAIQLKIDRSQQTSCTGDWTMVIIPCIEKHDKEQQTFFSESEIVVIGRPGSSFSKESMYIRSSSGKIFISEKSESQPTSSNEQIRRKSMTRSSFSEETKKDAQIHSEHGQDFSDEAYLPIPEEVSEEVQSPPAEEATVEETLAELQSPSTEETPAEEMRSDESSAAEEASEEETLAEVEPPKAEEASEEGTPADVQSPPTEKAHEEETSADIQSPPAEVAPEEETPADDQSPPAEEAPEEETPADDQSPPAEEAPEEESPAGVQSPPAEEAPEEETPADVQSPPAEETPAEVEPPPPEESTEEETPADVQSLPAEEAPKEEASAEVEPQETAETLVEVPSPAAKEAPSEEVAPEEVSDEVQTLPAEEEEAPAEAQSPPVERVLEEDTLVEVHISEDEFPDELQTPESEEAPTEVQSPPGKETAAEETPVEPHPLAAEAAPAEDQPPESEEDTVEKDPTDEQPPSPKETDIVQIPLVNFSDEVQPLSFEQNPVDETVVDNDSTDLQSVQARDDVPVIKLDSLIEEDEKNSEEALEPDLPPEDSSSVRKDQTSTIEIEGVIEIELQ